MDSFNWNWEYEKPWNQPSHFILYNVKIIYPTHRDDPLCNQTIYIMANEEYNDAVYLKATVMEYCGFNVLMVGSIPDGNSDKEILSDLKEMATNDYSRPCFENRTYQFFPGNPTDVICLNSLFSSLWVGDNDEPIIGAWHTREGRGDGNVQKTLEAYKHARQSRFEHGQHGYIKQIVNY